MIEVVVVMTIMGVMIAIPIPTFLRAVEQSKLDIAAADLRAIWAAQRFYHLENRTYADSLDKLAPGTADGDLIESTLTSGTSFYAYEITRGDAQSFTATATHPVQPRCTGYLSIDEGGTVTSYVYYDGELMTPSKE
jgi:Tfp pilus assembly protein PilE